MKAGDAVLLVLSLLVTGLSAWFVFSPSQVPLRVEVQCEKGLFVYPLDQDRELDVAGPLGLSHVDIQGGAAFVHDSPCTNQICISMGKISRPGQWVACLPNRLFVRITGRAPEGREVDAHAY